MKNNKMIITLGPEPAVEPITKPTEPDTDTNPGKKTPDKNPGKENDPWKVPAPNVEPGPKA
jgi:hypothetical protein